MMAKYPLVVLIVMDGWGIAPAGPGNAISQANTGNFSAFMNAFPHTQLLAAGEAVGLPRGEAGNTETGHLNLGAGQIVYQDLPRINMAIADGSFFKNEKLLGAIKHARDNNSNLHIMGLVGAGGVHSNIEHLYALLHLAVQEKFDRVYLHLFCDGRDSPPTAAQSYIAMLNGQIKKPGVGRVASVMGRYWAMDRDFRWERTGKAYFALTAGEGNKVKSAEEAIQASYAAGKTDEFIEPALIINETGKPVALVQENDAVIFFNFRIDRPRQLTKAFVLDDFEGQANKKLAFDPYAARYFGGKHGVQVPMRPVFTRGPKLTNLFFVTMTEYEKGLPTEVAFPPQVVEMSLGRVIANGGGRQLRAAESEKERFVTFYFNGQREAPFAGEEKLIVPSPNVATYDLKPEMSANELTAQVITRINSRQYKFILINFANPDMVGHTGNLRAAVEAVETVDECVGKLVKLTLALEGISLITADHGNCETMLNLQTGEVMTEHTTNPVPFVAVSNQLAGKPVILPQGILADVAPTVISALGMRRPESMTGRDLLANIDGG